MYTQKKIFKKSFPFTATRGPYLHFVTFFFQSFLCILMDILMQL